MIANYLSFFKLVRLIYKVEYGSSCLILPENRTMKYVTLALINRIYFIVPNIFCIFAPRNFKTY